MLILVGLPWFIMAAFTAQIAASKGRSPFWWFIIGAISGVTALLVITYFMPPLRPKRAPEERDRIEPRLERDDREREPWL
jgi:uncharacterized membrane protein YdcZ (DUF606 family)